MPIQPRDAPHIIAIGLMLFIAGSIGVWMGRPRRKGDQPHCRRCDYLLIGIASTRCPECGAAFSAESVRRGDPVRPTRIYFGGMASVVIGLGLLGFLSWKILGDAQWYQYKPAFLVIRDFRSPIANVQKTAWQELLRRDSLGKLSAGSQSSLVQAALAEQDKAFLNPLDSDVIQFLGQRLENGTLPADQRTRYLRQMARLKLSIRPIVIVGDQVPVFLQLESRSPTFRKPTDPRSDPPGLLDYHFDCRSEQIKMDGKPVEGAIMMAGPGGGIGDGAGSGIYLPCPAPGHHTLEISFLTRIQNSDTLLLSETRLVTGTFEVKAVAPPGFVKAIEDPNISAAVQSSVSIKNVFLNWTGDPTPTFGGDVVVTGAPANLAFTVYARYGGVEHRMGPVDFKKGGGSWYQFGGEGTKDIPPATVDIILRGDESIARRTIDMFDFWKGEIVFPNVPVKVSKSN